VPLAHGVYHRYGIIQAQKFLLPLYDPASITPTMWSDWKTNSAYDDPQRRAAFVAYLQPSLGATLPLMKLGKTSTAFSVVMALSWKSFHVSQ
jgi:hypothetical protein